MKNELVICITVIIFCSFLSCKKSNDAPATAPGAIAGPNWKDSLENTLWAGEFKYTNGTNTSSLQPFTMELKADGTVIWADELSIRDAGNWGVKGTEATLTFPNKTFLTAQVARDKFTNFSNPQVNGFAIENMNAAMPVVAKSLETSVYTGFLFSVPLNIRFNAGGTVRYNNNGIDFTVPYTIAGAGVRFVFSYAEVKYAIFLFPVDNYRKLHGFTHITVGDKSYYLNFTATR